MKNDPAAPTLGSAEWWLLLDEWLSHGVLAGYCTPPACGVHDGLPLTFADEQEYEPEGSGEPLCFPIVRVCKPGEELPYELLHPKVMEHAVSTVTSAAACVVCGGTAEVWHPDGAGEQLGYCGEHEPVTS